VTLLFATQPDEAALLEQWVIDHIPHCRRGFGPAVMAGVVQSGALVAGVAFHDWQEEHLTLQVSMAADSPRWASAAVLKGLFRYAFVTAGANKLWAAIPHTNTRALRFNAGIGLKREGCLRHHFGHKSHAMIHSMMRAEWQRSRWFGE
jgi:RimJ/RimL family protein N-acetyltransferase